MPDSVGLLTRERPDSNPNPTSQTGWFVFRLFFQTDGVLDFGMRIKERSFWRKRLESFERIWNEKRKQLTLKPFF